MGRPRTDIQPRLVHAARARFLAEGVDGASLRTIARDARTSIGMVSYYFPTKDDLFLAVVEEVYGRLLIDVEAALAGPGPVRGRLERAFCRLGEVTDQELEVIQLVIRESLVSSARLKKVLARAQRGHFPMVLGLLEEGTRSGELDAQIPLAVLFASTMAMGGVPQLIARGVRGRLPGLPFPESKALAKLSAELLFRAIGARKASALRPGPLSPPA